MSEDIDTAPPAALPPRNCTTCGKPATVAYTWEWGESGMACPEHAATLQQNAGNLNRTVTVVPLPAQGPTPLTRDERIKYNATILALEAEIEDLKSRGLELVRSNEDLAKQAQLFSMREREKTAYLEDAQAEVKQLSARLEEVETELADAVTEVERLRSIVKFTPGAQPPQQPPAGPTVVDGPR